MEDWVRVFGGRGILISRVTWIFFGVSPFLQAPKCLLECGYIPRQSASSSPRRYCLLIVVGSSYTNLRGLTLPPRPRFKFCLCFVGHSPVQYSIPPSSSPDRFAP